MKCPHCLTAFHEVWSSHHLGHDADGLWSVGSTACPTCKKLVVTLTEHYTSGQYKQTLLVHPKGISRSPLPREVPEKFALDFKEACLVLSDSEKASAALSRRCLQMLLRERAGVKPTNLDNEIQQILDSKQLPSHVAESIDAVRVVGNFAAHPIKSQSTGSIIDVEPGEAEWLLDVVESLFDFYFVHPAKIAAKRQALNNKLKEAGKPVLKAG